MGNVIADCNLSYSGVTVLGYSRTDGIDRFNIYTTGGYSNQNVEEYIGTIEIKDGKIAFFPSSKFDPRSNE